MGSSQASREVTRFALRRQRRPMAGLATDAARQLACHRTKWQATEHHYALGHQRLVLQQPTNAQEMPAHSSSLEQIDQRAILLAESFHPMNPFS